MGKANFCGCAVWRTRWCALPSTRAIPVRFWTRPPILVARLGGDEFVVLLPGLRDAQRDVQAISATIQGALGRPRTINGVNFRIKASMGLVAHDGVADAASMLAAADAEMYQHKKSQRPSRGAHIHAQPHR